VGDEQLVTIDDIDAARVRLDGVLRSTVTEASDTLSRLCGRSILLKPEHRQRTGSFKIRGAYNHISSLPPAGPDGRPTTVVTASAGNHAQGVALASTLSGLPSTIYMPYAASLPKLEATRAYGADVRIGGATVDDCLVEAKAHAATTGARFVPPFDDPLIIAGQGTVGLEVLDEAPDAEIVVVPIGGGGLVAGVAAAVRARKPGVRVVGVQAAGAPAMAHSIAAGRMVILDRVETMADGIALKSPSALTLAHCVALVDDVVTVTDAEIGRALILLLERAKAVVEPAGVVGLAALLAGKIPGDGPAVAVLSGGNVDPLMLTRLIEHGLSAAGRYLRLRVVVPDRPGALAQVTGDIARLGLNVLEVTHHRAGVRVELNQVEVLLTLETRDPEHRLEIVDLLRSEGFTVDVIS
jgi:threonine dehydratase